MPPFDDLGSWLIGFLRGTSAPNMESLVAARNARVFNFLDEHLSDPTFRTRVFLQAATGTEYVDASRPVTVSLHMSYV